MIERDGIVHGLAFLIIMGRRFSGLMVMISVSHM